MTQAPASLDAALRAAIVAALQSPEGQAALRAALQQSAPVVHLEARIGSVKVRRAAEISDCCTDTIRRAIKAKDLKAAKPKGSREWLVEYSELRRWMSGRGVRPGPVDIAGELDKAVARARR